MPIVKLDLPGSSGLTLTLWVYQDGVLVNTGGDSLTEVGSSGHFQANVSEPLDGVYVAHVKNASGAVIGYGDLDSDILYVGRTEATSTDILQLEALVNKIITKLATSSSVISGQQTPSSIALIRGDSYDDISRPAFVWDVGKNIDGKPIKFTIKDNSGTVLVDQDDAGATISGAGTVVTLEILSTATRDLPLGQHDFDVEIRMASDSDWTPILGRCVVSEDFTITAI
jgi:hypothetical protein